jgi:hypothetical protein
VKPSLLLIFFLITYTLSGQSSDANTGISSFEIQLNRPSPNRNLGFNTSSIDRHEIYQLVTAEIRNKIHTKDIQSLHSPEVEIKFDEYISNSGRHRLNEISEAEIQSLQQGGFNYFIKIFGSLDMDGSLNQNPSATFILKVFIFDMEGNLLFKTKSRSKNTNFAVAKNTHTPKNTHPINEQDFVELVKEAASTLEISM